MEGSVCFEVCFIVILIDFLIILTAILCISDFDVQSKLLEKVSSNHATKKSLLFCKIEDFCMHGTSAIRSLVQNVLRQDSYSSAARIERYSLSTYFPLLCHIAE